MIQKIWNNILDLFYPNLCLVCTEPLVEGEKFVCLYCLCALPHTHYHKRKDNPVEQLFMGKVPIVRASSFLFYQKENSTQILIYALKYKGNKELAYTLGRLAALELKAAGSELCTVDLLIPVPLHPKKEKRRGYNQSEWIAAGMSSVLNIPVDTLSLRRTKQTETQTKKSIFNRWLNVDGIFSLAENNSLAGKHALLIDDVITTGSTIGASANALSVLPGIQISIFSLALA